jgi:large subunit ribosomal protein L17
MRHKHKGRKFGRNTAHRRALLMNLAKAVITHESIETTVPKAKDIRPLVEKLVTKAMKASLHIKRQLYAFFGNDKVVVDKLLHLANLYKGRPGGYLRIIKTGFRQGDAAPMAIVQFVEQIPSTVAAAA